MFSLCLCEFSLWVLWFLPQSKGMQLVGLGPVVILSINVPPYKRKFIRWFSRESVCCRLKKIAYTHLSDDISQNRDSRIENLFLVTRNEARSKDWKDFTVIHPSGSTGLSVTNTRHTAWLLPSSEQYLAPAQRSDLSHSTLSQKTKPSHMCL